MKLCNFVSILLVSGTLATYANWILKVRDDGGDISRISGSSTVAGIPLLRLEEAERLHHESSTIFIDVRSTIDYEFGHIAGAINIPEEEFEKQLPNLQPRLERARAIVVYCKNKDCGKSLWSAIRLHQAGLKQAKIYPYGWNEWINNQLPHAGTAQ